MYIIRLIMSKRVPTLLPRLDRLLTSFGDNLRKARLRRKFSARTVAERAGISRKTLYRVERGDPSVSFGAYVRVMQVLRLEGDLAKLAADDVMGRKLQDLQLKAPRWAPKRPAGKPEGDGDDNG